MEKKQTAVEWLVEQIEEKGESWENVSIGRTQISIKVEDYLNLIAQAKAMERVQIEDAFDIRKIDISFDKKTTAEQYYNETYSSKVNDECYFEPTNNTSSATICKHCGKEKSLHTIT